MVCLVFRTTDRQQYHGLESCACGSLVHNTQLGAKRSSEVTSAAQDWRTKETRAHDHWSSSSVDIPAANVPHQVEALHIDKYEKCGVARQRNSVYKYKTPAPAGRGVGLIYDLIANDIR